MGHHTGHCFITYRLLSFFQVLSHLINTDKMTFSVDDKEFVPDTEYSARVQSSPNQAFYMGQWSSWSSEIHWKTEPSVKGESPPNRRPI